MLNILSEVNVKKDEMATAISDPARQSAWVSFSQNENHREDINSNYLPCSHL